MKKIELTFLGLLVPFDYIMLIIAGTLSYFLRFNPQITKYKPVIFDLPFNNYFNLLLLTSFFWIIIFALNGLYSADKINRLLKTFIQLIIASTAATMVIIIAFFFNQQLFNSRLIILIFWLSSIFFVFFGRIAHNLILKFFYWRGLITKNSVIIGSDNNAKTLISEFKKYKKYGVKVIEHFTDFKEKTKNDLINLNQQVKIDEIIQADTGLSPQQICEIINFCYDQHINLRYAASLYDTKLKNFEIKTVVGIPLIEIKNTPLDGWWKITKRIFDIIFTSFFIILLSPSFILISLLIKLDTSGSVFVSFDRIGEKNKKFKLYKFRSMIKNAHLLKLQMQNLNERSDGPLFKITNDPRITKFGKILRKFSLDELPQLFNVLKGEMSLVGPRPHEAAEVANYQTHHKKLLSIRPGLTGLAAISGRSNLLFEDEVKLDTFYIENWSILLDLIILMKTPFKIFSQKAV